MRTINLIAALFIASLGQLPGAYVTLDDFTVPDLITNTTASSVGVAPGVTRTGKVQNPYGDNPTTFAIEFGNGIADYRLGVNDGATFMTWWELDQSLVPAGATNIRLVLTVIGSDGNEPIDLVLGGSVVNGSVEIPGNSFLLGFSFPAVSAGPGKVILSLDGPPGSDIALGEIGFLYDTAEVPEPSTYAMVGVGLVALSLKRRR